MSLRMMVAGLMVLTAIGLGMIAFQLYQPPQQVVVQQQQQPAPPPPPRAKYLVASRALPAGTLARDEDFRAVDMEPGKLPDGTLQDTPEVRADLRGALVRNYIDARQPITPEAVLRPRDRGFLAAVLAPGTRATSIPVDVVTGVSGLIWPGDRVDVMLLQEFGADVAPLPQR